MTTPETVGDAASSDLAPPAPPAGGVAHPAVEQLLTDLLVADGAGTVVFGLDGTLLDANAVAHRVLRIDRSSRLTDESPAWVLLRSLLDQIPQQLLSDPSGGTWHGAVDLVLDDETPRVIATTVVVRHDPTSSHGGTIAAIGRDVTDEHDVRERLRHELEHDTVTGLFNRRAALDHTARAVEQLGDQGGHVAVLVIDVDLLRDVNDALGHDIGDRLLASTAKRLASAVRPTDLIARVGGDEFLVLCHHVPDATVAMDVADRVRRALTGRLSIKQLELDVSVSVGVAITDPHTLEQPSQHAAIDLLTHADTAVHAAKAAGRARTALFTDEMRSNARARTGLAAALQRALRAEELVVEYQPIFSAVSERAEAAEALLRWDHPTRGRLEASDFVSVAEETGVIVQIGEWVLRRACTDTRRWIDDGVVGQRFSVHVNVSRLQLAEPAFVNGVVELLREHRLRPRQLVLEARENTLLGDRADVARTVRALRRVGVRVALDNFGTGADALSILTDIGADVLKLDGGLALPHGASDADTRVVRALVLLAHALNMEVVAERVSGLEQLRRLRAAGCDLVQGHLLGRPCPATELHVHMEH